MSAGVFSEGEIGCLKDSHCSQTRILNKAFRYPLENMSLMVSFLDRPLTSWLL